MDPQCGGYSLPELLHPMSLSLFKQEFLRKQPYARPGSARGALRLFDWERIDELLGREPSDALVVAKGKLVELPTPRDANDLRLLMQAGIGIVLRRVEREDWRLAELAQSFADDLGGEPHIQLIATPGGTHGFAWHYDREDVFIVQTYGVKQYFFRENTVTGDIQSTAMDFERFNRESSPLGTATLIAGDWLYVPAGWWHMAKCVEDSLSISIGVLLKAAQLCPETCSSLS